MTRWPRAGQQSRSPTRLFVRWGLTNSAYSSSATTRLPTIRYASENAAPAAIFRRPNWLPLALIIGDVLIAGAAVILAYEYRYHLDRIPQVLKEPLAFGPYVAAIPVVVALFLFALAINQQYRSWRGRTLVDQLFAMGSGLALEFPLANSVIPIMSHIRGICCRPKVPVDFAGGMFMGS